MVRARALLAVALLTAVLSGCGSTSPAPAPTESESIGDVIGQTPIAYFDPTLVDSTSWTRSVTYVTDNAVDNSLHHATASIYVPKGAPPPGGYSILALNPPVAGTGRGCQTPATSVADSSVLIQAFLAANYVVVIPDYLGLGRPWDNEPNFHPYLDSATAADNTIDAVRAVHNVVPQASTSWVAVGTAQGGQASWAANEEADNYGYGLNLKGTASISPTADVEGLADAAAAGELTEEQEMTYVTYLDALSKEYPDDFHLDDYRRGVVAENWDLLLSCTGAQAAQRASIIPQVGPDDLRPASPDALGALRGYLHKTNLPQGPAQAPMLVAFGTRDPLIPSEWTQRALDRACALGDTIAIRKLSDDELPTIGPITAEWIADRFTDKPAANDCSSVSVESPEGATPVPAAPPSIVHPRPIPVAAAPIDKGAASPRVSTSLIDGWLPIAIQVVTVSVLIVAVGWRSRRWLLRGLPAACAVGVTVVAVAYWYVDDQGWGHDPPWGMWAWIAVAGFAGGVLAFGWRAVPWWRRIFSLLAVPLAVISAASVLNVSLGYLPTVATAWDVATGSQPPEWIDQSRLATLVRDGTHPTKGTIVSVAIPSDQSGFAHEANWCTYHRFGSRPAHHLSCR